MHRNRPMRYGYKHATRPCWRAYMIQRTMRRDGNDATDSRHTRGPAGARTQPTDRCPAGIGPPQAKTAPRGTQHINRNRQPIRITNLHQVHPMTTATGAKGNPAMNDNTHETDATSRNPANVTIHNTIPSTKPIISTQTLPLFVPSYLQGFSQVLGKVKEIAIPSPIRKRNSERNPKRNGKQPASENPRTTGQTALINPFGITSDEEHARAAPPVPGRAPAYRGIRKPPSYP